MTGTEGLQIQHIDSDTVTPAESPDDILELKASYVGRSGLISPEVDFSARGEPFDYAQASVGHFGVYHERVTGSPGMEKLSWGSLITPRIEDRPFEETPLESLIDEDPTGDTSRNPEARTYTYLRDNHGATTAGEAADIIRSGQVPREVVESWIKAGAVGVYIIDDAMSEAYPDLADKISAAATERTQRVTAELRGEPPAATAELRASDSEDTEGIQNP